MTENTQKVQLFNYYQDTRKDSGNITHGSVHVKCELHNLINEALELGLDIMIKQSKEQPDNNVVMILFYSDKGFSQR
ncbi:hypothetical protein VCHA53O466_140205 [Vibrio chagasii]|nr:hypothetical protein VCHA53O466_140205 [Vibrio chagasii]